MEPLPMTPNSLLALTQTPAVSGFVVKQGTIFLINIAQFPGLLPHNNTRYNLPQGGKPHA